MLLLIVFVLLILGFALYGIITCMSLLFTTTPKANETVVKPNTGIRDLKQDVIGACYLLNHLAVRKQLPPTEYQRLRQFLDKHFGGKYELPSFIESKRKPQVQQQAQPQIEIEPAHNQPKVRTIGKDTTEQLIKPELVIERSSAVAAITKPAVAPWDIPDDPAPAVPRRSLSDALGAFMQEKNIRWGELASGILIVGSAVGLVVSLRNELSQTIPYFTAMLFMLITAAIHIAGSYTLKKWKLQKTSRGTLLIGLLLVPLNFLAACVLSNNGAERSLTNPVYWLAVIGGLGIFGFLTARSSKLLLRAGHLPVVVGTLAAAVMTLVANRLPLPASIWAPLLFSVPVGAALFFGSGVWQQSLRQKSNWTSRSSNRLYILFGLALFAVLTTLSLLVLRAPDKSIAIVSLTPLITFGSLLACWVGSIISSAVAQKSDPTGQVASRSLSVLGAIIALLSACYSIFHPTMLLFNGLVVGAMFWVVAVERNKPWMLFGAWAGIATTLMMVVNISVGEISMGDWISPLRYFKMLTSGRTGMSLMGLAAVIVAAVSLQKPASQKTEKLLRVTNLNSAAGLALLGAAVSLVAGLINRGSVFDTMTATILLSIAAISSLVVAARKSPWYVPHVASVVLIAATAFTFLWNPTTSGFWTTFALPIPTATLATFLVHAALLILVACFRSSDNLDAKTNINLLSYHAATSLAVSAVISFVFSNAETGIPTLAMMVIAIGVLGITWAQRKIESAFDWPNLFVIATASLLGISLIECSNSLGFCSWNVPKHWLMQIWAATVLALVWSMLNLLLSNRPNWKWMFGKQTTVDQTIRGEQVLLGCAGAALVSIIGFGLSEGIGQQLVAGFESQMINSDGFMLLGPVAVALVFAATLFNHVFHSSKLSGIGLVAIWCLGWTMPAFGFDEANASATALRWLMSIGAIATAVLVGSRKFFTGKQAKSLLPIEQSMINWSLGIPVVGVLAITTATIGRVMLTEAQTAALGGPIAGTWFANVSMELSYGVPAILITSALLVFAISEQRRWLAMMGSAVYQYVVLLAVALLFLSPHPQLATKWFLNILQAVSLGMSVYGLFWFAFRKRIRGGFVPNDSGWNQLAVHAGINAFLITSLAVLIGWRFFTNPLQSAGWVNAAGGPLGLVALFLAGVLVFLVSREQAAGERQESLFGVNKTKGLVAWAGLTLSAMTAACLDHYLATPMIGLRTIAVGSMTVLSVIVWLTHVDHRTTRKESSALPVLLVSIIAGMFLVRGGLVDPNNAQVYVLGLAAAVGLVSVTGVRRKIFSLQYIAAGLVVAAVCVLANAKPSWAADLQTIDFVSLLLALLGVLGCVWVFVHATCVKDQKRPAAIFSVLPNLLFWFSSLWLFVGGFLELAEFANTFPVSGFAYLRNPLGLVATAAVILYAIVSLWHDHVRFRVATRFLMSIGIFVWGSGGVARLLDHSDDGIVLAASFGIATAVFSWGLIWVNRTKWQAMLTKLSAPDMESLEKRMSIELPIYALLVTSGVLIFSTLCLCFLGSRPLRYFAAFTPFVSAIGIGCLSNQSGRRWLQMVTLLIGTYATLLLSWADLELSIFSNQQQVRTLLVFAGAMFVYGILIPRWAREGDGWLKSLRSMSMITCVAAFASLVVLIIGEYQNFIPEVGCRLSVAESVAAGVVICGMIAGLLGIAMRPRLDPFSLTIDGRKTYVYIAQTVIVLLVVHLYLTMPGLFQFGILEFWPYVAMLISFVGVGVASVLKRRNLEVLADPFFKTAIVIPVVTSIAVFLVDAPAADAAVVLLVAGLAYLLVSYTQRSILSGTLAVVLGNLALWIFYDRLQGFSFVEHPQLWLIPPAVSVLIAAHFTRNKLSAGQLAAIRYISVAVIYISSTSEVFISGIGSQLWPPMVLALLAVIGMFAGIAMQIRAYLYLGSTFLLTAMIAMVSHAHQRLEHVWPWWAFGIVLGISILVMFGVFEKRRNHLRTISGRLQKWEL